MSGIDRYSVDWAGDMIKSPHGDWVSAREVERLEDEVEALRRARAVMAERVAELEAEPPAAKVDGVRLFGWVSPDDARRFNSGGKDSCRVFKKRTELFCMPLSNTLGPNHYQKPPVGAVVTIYGGMSAVVSGHVAEGLTVSADGIEFNVDKWSWKR